MTKEERRALVDRRDREKVRAADRERHKRQRDDRIARMREYAGTEQGKAVMGRARGRWQKENPEKRAASVAVGNAVRDGVLVRPEVCEVGGPDCRGRIEAHHENYSRPLEIVWLCTAHHRVADEERRAMEDSR